jgi:hypothetical protein
LKAHLANVVVVHSFGGFGYVLLIDSTVRVSVMGARNLGMYHVVGPHLWKPELEINLFEEFAVHFVLSTMRKVISAL